MGGSRDGDFPASNATSSGDTNGELPRKIGFQALGHSVDGSAPTGVTCRNFNSRDPPPQ